MTRRHLKPKWKNIGILLFIIIGLVLIIKGVVSIHNTTTDRISCITSGHTQQECFNNR